MGILACWQMESQLLGVAFTCAVWHVSTDLIHSDVAECFFLYRSSMFERTTRRDMKVLHESVSSFVNGGLSPQHPSDLKGRIENVVQKLPDQTWDMLAAFWNFSVASLSARIDALSALDTLPCLFILGDNCIPLASIHPARHLRKTCLPQAQLRFTEDSKIWWFLESEGQLRSVTLMLDAFLKTMSNS
eukprot:TRINITY_DN12369_c0_g2_i1.p1 TRINITY_DN12369_c0_g2~~TRINITY_DN12369_c0_g2_i1.p1  ORF type:complete len:214 (-),score=30.96 TRINITY_DN12369_c0_g2_i1:127-690(-)